jgi:hypothetical protein
LRRLKSMCGCWRVADERLESPLPSMTDTLTLKLSARHDGA